MKGQYTDYGCYSGKRWFSYAHQLHAIEELAPKSVLEIGVGAGMVAACLKCSRVSATTMDIDASLCPDHVGSVTCMPFADASFDAVCCCQVLEHLPYDQFAAALREIRRVCTSGAVISLPDVGRQVCLNLRLPKVGRVSWDWQLPGTRRMTPHTHASLAEMGHFWEISYSGQSLRQVCNEIKRTGFHIRRTWRVPEFEWHRFFLLV